MLVVKFPLGIRHAIDDGLSLRVVEFQTALLGRTAVPFGKTVAAEIGEDHEIDILDFWMLLQVLEQSSEGGGLKGNAGFFVHSRVCLGGGDQKADAI